MILSVLSIVALAATGLHMLQTAKGKAARRLSVVPLLMTVCEVIVMGVLEVGAFPMLTLALMACRVTVISSCLLVLKKDAASARARSRVRQQLRRSLRNALTEEVEDRKIVAIRRVA